MFVSEIITEQEFTFQRDVKSGTYTILNPQGQPVGSERTPGAARAEVKKLTKKRDIIKNLNNPFSWRRGISH